MTLSASRSFVYCIFNLEMYSLVIKIAILVNKAVLLEIIIPRPGMNKPIVGELIVEADPNIISVIFNNTLFSFEDLLFSLNIPRPL